MNPADRRPAIGAPAPRHGSSPDLGAGSGPWLALAPPAPWPGTPREGLRATLFLLAHIPLGIALRVVPLLSTAHALAAVLFGFWLVQRGRKEQGRLVALMAYIVGSEPIWRATGARVFYETGKYALVALAIYAVLRFNRLGKFRLAPLAYFFFLVPSLLVLPYFSKDDISFNLSGPMALGFAAAYLGGQRMDLGTVRRTLTGLLAPILSLVTIASFSTVTTSSINFYSSKVASGGLGQNQASSALGLAALVAFLLIFQGDLPRRFQWVVTLVGLWCAGQGLLTFSRGGMLTALIAAAAAGFFLLQDRRSRSALVARTFFAALVGLFLLWPFLNTFTGGELENRFRDDSLTGRDRIIEGDLLAFQENPLLGVGPGQSRYWHALTFKVSAAHTEYTRTLAEHGSLGAISLLLLTFLSIRNVLSQRTPAAKALAAAFTVWTLLFMFHAALRMAAPAFVFAFAGGRLLATMPVHGARQTVRSPVGGRGWNPAWGPNPISARRRIQPAVDTPLGRASGRGSVPGSNPDPNPNPSPHGA